MLFSSSTGGVCLTFVYFVLHELLPCLQIESDCPGHETETYTFFIDEVEVGSMTDNKFDTSFNSSGSTAHFTLMIPEEVSNSGVMTVMLSNTVSFLENTNSSSSGVNSTLRNNTWTTISAPYCLKCMLISRITLPCITDCQNILMKYVQITYILYTCA